MKIPCRALARDAEADAWVDPGTVFGPVYEEHPAVIRCRRQGMPDGKIRPLAVYWDCVQYGKKQSFVAMTSRQKTGNICAFSFVSV